jgi:hypothetical protein
MENERSGSFSSRMCDGFQEGEAKGSIRDGEGSSSSVGGGCGSKAVPDLVLLPRGLSVLPMRKRYALL